MKSITKELRDKTALSTLVILSIALVAFLRINNINFQISPENYQIVHLFVETIIIITASSIFLLLHYSYPYENKTRYVVSGSLFLCIVIINIMHVYFNFVGNDLLRTLTANLVHLTMSIVLFLFAVLPEKPFKLKRWFISVFPALIVFVNFSLFMLSRKLYINFLALPSGGLSRNFFLDIISSIFYLFSLIRFIREYKKSGNVIYSSLIYSILFLIYACVMLIFVKTPSDIYSIISHIFKITGVVFIFKAYFVTSIKIPYEGLKDARRFAVEASNIKTDFIVNLSHELRTPVNVILSALKVLDIKDKQSPHIKSIEKNALRLNKVCENIILFNEIENGLAEVNLSDTDVVYIIDEILEEAERIADEKGLEIVFAFETKDIILTDSEKLKTIILNLVSNAIKYVPPGGTVNLLLEIGEALELHVMNNGPEIQDEDRFRIFDKFYKSTDNTLCSREGLGIGLYISKIYAELLGGSLEALNSNDFTGYRLIIPVEKRPGHSASTNPHNIRGYFADIS